MIHHLKILTVNTLCFEFIGEIISIGGWLRRAPFSKSFDLSGDVC
jgi:hypothetical protein